MATPPKEATVPVEESLAEVALKRNLSHLLISNSTKKAPEFTLGDTKFHFKPKAPVTALALLISEDNRVKGLQGYINLCLIPEDREDFAVIQDDLDLDGLNEIINALSEVYSTLPTE
jgi:hypothetical protein